MIKNVEVEINFTGEEMALGLWEMDCDEQANFLAELSRLYRFNKVDFLAQLQYVADEVNCGAESVIYNKALIVRMLEEVLDYVKGDGEAVTWSTSSNHYTKCPICGIGLRDTEDFCGNCGADMREGEASMDKKRAVEVLKIEFNEGFPCLFNCRDFCEKCDFYNAVKFAFDQLENQNGGDE